MPESIFALEIFKWIPRDVVENIIANCPEKNFSQGEIVIMEWEESNWEGYILKTGKVTISIWGQKVAELHTGDIFGEIALLNEEERTATVSALDDIEVLVLSIDSLIEMINNDENKINKKIMTRIEENINR